MDEDLYQSSEWKEKRIQILERDNFTCQNCQTFNPSLGSVTIINSLNGSIEIHEYQYRGESSYSITSMKYGIVFRIKFGLDYLVLPILQVHHKRYIIGKLPWEYDDSDLITICKECHLTVHKALKIPVFTPELDNYSMVQYNPEYFNESINSTFTPWSFITLNCFTKEYESVKFVHPEIEYFLPEDKNDQADEIKHAANQAVEDLFKKFIPFYSSQ